MQKLNINFCKIMKQIQLWNKITKPNFLVMETIILGRDKNLHNNHVIYKQ